VKSSSNKVDHPLSGSVNGFANGTFLQNIFFFEKVKKEKPSEKLKYPIPHYERKMPEE
jgi:hypothetical protein